MKIVSNINEWKHIRSGLSDKTIGLVMTMGNLHAGHMSLCERAKRENDISVVSIFVNPTQFNQELDYTLYPRTLEQDQQLLSKHQVDYLLLPSYEALYPDNYQIRVTETEMSQQLDGEFRPGHFTGMLTVVNKILNLVQPSRAYFGEKDYQQLLLVKKMVETLFIPTQIVGCPTIRAEDGLALSSRNSRLSVEQRHTAAHLPRLLQSPQEVEVISKELAAMGFKVEYVVEKWNRRLAAVWLGEVRLIDNYLGLKTGSGEG